MSTNIEESCSNKKEAEGLSHFESHSIIYTWKIDEISSFLKSAKITEENVVIINSPEFSTNAKIKDLWHLQMRIKNDDESSKNKTWVSIYICRKNRNQRVRTKYLIFLLNDKKEKVIWDFQIYNQSVHKKVNHIFPSSTDGHGYSEYMKIDELLQKKKEFYPNNILTICIDLTVYDDDVKIDNSPKSLKFDDRGLADDFKDLLVNKKNCDVVIKAGDECFDAHKFILSARSCVFEAMFSHNMKENKENEVNIPDVDPEVFKKVLDYIYTDNVDELDNFAEELFEASDKYQLNGLKKLSACSLFKTLNPENAVRILILANRHNVQELKEPVINYIVSNFDKLKGTEDFKALELSHPPLFYDILKKMFKC